MIQYSENVRSCYDILLLAHFSYIPTFVLCIPTRPFLPFLILGPNLPAAKNSSSIKVRGFFPAALDPLEWMNGCWSIETMPKKITASVWARYMNLKSVWWWYSWFIRRVLRGTVSFNIDRQGWERRSRCQVPQALSSKLILFFIWERHQDLFLVGATNFLRRFDRFSQLDQQSAETGRPNVFSRRETQ